MRTEFNDDFKDFISTVISDSDKYVSKVSPGMTKWTNRPWAGLLNKDSTDTFQGGLYLIYSFDFERNGFYLSLDQGSNYPVNKFRVKISDYLIKLISQKNLNLPSGFISDKTRLYEDIG